MESDQSIFHDLQYSGNRWSNYFRQNPERLSYGLLALLYILILALFITVFSNSSSSGNLQLVSKKEINDFNSKVSKLSSEMDRLQSTFIKKKCQDDWIQFENSCYYISKTRFDWTAARTMCQNKESDLLVINSAKEQLFISGKTNPSSYRRFWLGLHDTDEEGLWKWMDETNYETSYKGKNTAMILAACPLAPMKVFAICYIDIQKGEALTHPPLILEFRLGTVVKKFWTKGEPNDHEGEEDCALLWTNGEWNDVPCSYDSSYAVCEKKL